MDETDDVSPQPPTFQPDRACSQTNDTAKPPAWPQKRIELLNWFRTHARPLAKAYEGAVRLLADPTFPGRIHFISHAVRDIADRLPFVLDPQLPASRVAYEHHMDRIAQLWPEIDNVVASDSSPAPNFQLTVDYELAKRIDDLVNSHTARRNRASHSDLLFRYLMRNEPTQTGVNQRLARAFKKTHDWFMKWAHLRDKESEDVSEEELVSQFCAFEAMLHSFVGNFFTGTAEIDEILLNANRR